MVDDVLNSFLGNIDGNNNDKNSQNESSKEADERVARKSDRKIVENSSIDNEITLKKSIIEHLKKHDISEFKEGFLNVLIKHEEIGLSFKQVISDIGLPENVHSELSKYKYNFIRNVEFVDKLYNDFVTSYSLDGLTKKVKNEFYMFFQNEQTTKNRIEFLIIKELFLRLREFNSKCKKSWNELKASIGIINSFNGGNDLYKKCSSLIDEIVEFSERTDNFVKLLAIMLALTGEDYNVIDQDINKKILYFEKANYEFKSLFEYNLEEKIEEDKKDQPKLDAEVQEKQIVQNEAIPDVQESNKIDVNKNINILDSNGFTIKGTSNWNTREPYTLEINNSKLVSDINDLKQSIHFNEEKPDPVKVNGIVKRAMFKYLRDNSFNINERYDEFMYKTIIQIVQNIGEIFNKTDSDLYLLIYHIGPLSVYKIIIETIENYQIGLCYKCLSDNRVSRIIPKDFIKRKILNWYESNINTFALPFDSITEFNNIKKEINNKYNDEYKKNLQKIDQVADHYYQKTGKRINKSEMLRKKANELFGIESIVIYKRFVEKTIFK